MSLVVNLMVRAAIIRADLNVPDINADFNTGPARAFLQLTNQILAIGTVLAVVGFIAAAVMLTLGGLSERNKPRAWIALGICAVGAMVLGSITSMMYFFGNIPLF